MEKEIRAIGRTTRIVDECMQVLLKDKTISHLRIGGIIGKHHPELVGDDKLFNAEYKVVETRIMNRIKSEHVNVTCKILDNAITITSEYKTLTVEDLNRVINKIKFEPIAQEISLLRFAKDKCKNCAVYKQFGEGVVCSCSL